MTRPANNKPKDDVHAQPIEGKLPAASAASLPYAKSEHEVRLIDTPQDYALAAKLIAKERAIGIDTESAFFDDETEDKGRFALLQISLPNQKITLLIDPIAAADPDARTVVHRDLGALKAVLEDPKISKFAHNASFESSMLRQVGIELASLVDTKTLLQKLRPDFPSLSLRSASKYLLGLDLEKEQQTSAWNVRPLSIEQLAYAALDPEIAYRIGTKLQEIERQAVYVSKLSTGAALKKINEISRKLDELIDRECPDLRVREARITAVEEQLKERFPGGKDNFTCEFGAVYPGRLQRELDLRRLESGARSDAIPDEFRDVLISEIERASAQPLSKGAVLDALAKTGAAKLGFAKKDDIDTYLKTFMTSPPSSKATVESAYKRQQPKPMMIDPAAPADQLLKRLSRDTIEILTLFRDSHPEIPALRNELRMLSEHAAVKIVESQKSFSSKEGKVALGGTRSTFNEESFKADFRTRFARELSPRAMDEILEGARTYRLSKAGLIGILNGERFQGLPDDVRGDLIRGSLVESSKYGGTTVVPYT